MMTRLEAILFITIAACLVIGMGVHVARSAPMDDVKQYAMVLTATELMENAQCGTAQQAVTFDRLANYGVEIRGRDAGLFLQTVNAIAIIYREDPAGFCRRAVRAAGR